MYTNNHKGMRKNKKAIAASITSVVVILLALGVVAYITYKGINGGFLMIKEIFNKYGPPKINDTTAFLYKIEGFNIVNAADVGCSAEAGSTNTYACPTGKYIDFSVNIKNSGTLMRKITGAIVVCKVECKRGKCEPKGCSQDVTARGDACYVTVDEILECDAGSNQFSAGSYIVYPVAICALQQTAGCYSPNMREADKIFDSQKYYFINAK